MHVYLVFLLGQWKSLLLCAESIMVRLLSAWTVPSSLNVSIKAPSTIVSDKLFKAVNWIMCWFLVFMKEMPESGTLPEREVSIWYALLALNNWCPWPDRKAASQNQRTHFEYCKQTLSCHPSDHRRCSYSNALWAINQVNNKETDLVLRKESPMNFRLPEQFIIRTQINLYHDVGCFREFFRWMSNKFSLILITLRMSETILLLLFDLIQKEVDQIRFVEDQVPESPVCQCSTKFFIDVTLRVHARNSDAINL